MTPDQIFSIANLAAVACWFLLAVVPDRRDCLGWRREAARADDDAGNQDLQHLAHRRRDYMCFDTVPSLESRPPCYDLESGAEE